MDLRWVLCFNGHQRKTYCWFSQQEWVCSHQCWWDWKSKSSQQISLFLFCGLSFCLLTPISRFIKSNHLDMFAFKLFLFLLSTMSLDHINWFLNTPICLFSVSVTWVWLEWEALPFSLSVSGASSFFFFHLLFCFLDLYYICSLWQSYSFFVIFLLNSISVGTKAVFIHFDGINSLLLWIIFELNLVKPTLFFYKIGNFFSSSIGSLCQCSAWIWVELLS